LRGESGRELGRPADVRLARRGIEAEVRGDVLTEDVAIDDRHVPAALAERGGKRLRDRRLAGPGQPGQEDHRAGRARRAATALRLAHETAAFARRRRLTSRRMTTQARLPSTSAASAARNTRRVSRPSRRSPEARSSTARARRITPPGARLEICAPMNAPGIAPSSSDTVIAAEKLPNRTWPSAAAPMSGMAWVRSVPTREDAFSPG